MILVLEVHFDIHMLHLTVVEQNVLPENLVKTHLL